MTLHWAAFGTAAGKVKAAKLRQGIALRALAAGDTEKAAYHAGEALAILAGCEDEDPDLTRSLRECAGGPMEETPCTP